VRGDSLRDLYAKTLAVMGLGLLAAAGAVVDYWPVGGELPRVPTLAALRPSLPAAVQLQQEVPAPATVRLTRASLTTERTFAHSLRTVKFVSDDQVLMDAPLEAAPVPDAGVIALEDCSQTLFAATGNLELDLAPPVDLMAAGTQEDPHWSLTGAMRRTRDSLKDARLFLGTKLGGVVGAFRRVSPFWDTTPLTQLR
jgi:hypothetical protein